MENLDKILELHKMWLEGKEGGECAHLAGADLTGADLTGVNLTEAKIWDANLTGADLTGVNLTEAKIWDANLTGANLTAAHLAGADLTGAHLTAAHLTQANLWDADLTGANLTAAHLAGADLTGATLPDFQIPQEGELIVWGKKNSTLVKLLVPAEAKRTGCLINRKCRAEFVRVLEVHNKPKAVCVMNQYGDTWYCEGELTYPDSYDDDIRVDCTHGIHFFLTKEEAERW